LGDDDLTKEKCLLSNNKGLGDAWLIYKGLDYTITNNIVCKNIFKMSGRYRLNSNFNRTYISDDLPTFKCAIDNVYITFCFSIPFTLKYLFLSNIVKTTQFFENRSDISIEVYLPSLFERKHIVETFGAEGIIAIDTTNTLYKV